MQGIGIIPEAGSLTGAPAAQSGGSAAADGFLALLASLNGGAGLLIQPQQRTVLGKQVVTAAEGPQDPTVSLAAIAPAVAGQSKKHGGTSTDSLPEAQIAVAAAPQANSAPQTVTPVTPAGSVAKPTQTPVTPAADPRPLAPQAQPNPAANGGTAGAPASANGQAQAPFPATPQGPNAFGTPAQQPGGFASGVPGRQADGAKPTALASAQTPTTASGGPAGDRGAQAAQAAAGLRSPQPTAQPKGAPQPQPSSLVAQAEPQAPGLPQGQTGTASVAATSLQAQAADKPAPGQTAMPLGQAATASAAASQDSASRERTLVASTHPNATAAAKTAKPGASAGQTNAKQNETVAKVAANEATQSAQGAQQTARPSLWSAAIANAQLLASIDRDGFMTSGSSADAGLEPLNGPGSTGLTGSKSVAEGYASSTNRLAYIPPSDQVAVQIQRAISAQAQRFSIRLEPAELGRIDVRLDFSRDGKLQAAITVERPETFDLLQRDIQSLERSLKESGLDGKGLELDLQLGEGGQEQREAAADQLNQGGTAKDVEEDAPVLPDLAAMAPPRAATGLVDIRA